MSDSTWSDALWRKSSRSGGGGQCVEVAVMGDQVAIRDSKDPDGPMLIFPADAWRSFVRWIIRDSGDDGR